ncbi:hypothetical protein B0H11DRAFT_2020177 [Mycena galericulata]|nr:hypothetical protein B0H11DRAFT_2020177 [Mycena galericulata]
MAFFTRPQSANAAITIKRPTTTENDQPIKQAVSRKDSTQRQCRNIMIYGWPRDPLTAIIIFSSCKFENKGCVYYHPPARPCLPRAESPAKALLSSPSLSAKAVNAPVFVPKLPVSIQTSTPPPESPPSPEYQDDQQQLQQHDVYDEYASYPAPGAEGQTQDTYEPGAENPYFAQAPVFVRQPLNYHLYTSVMPPAFVSSVADTHFIRLRGDLRTLLQGRSEDLTYGASARQVSTAIYVRYILILVIRPQSPRGNAGIPLPYPLENIGGPTERRKFGNWNSTVYRAINSLDGGTYVLRRIENFRLNHQAAFSAIETWASISAPRASWPCTRRSRRTAFGDSSLVVAYATLFDAHLKLTPPAYQHGTRFQPAPAQKQVQERTLWSYIVQLAGAIKRVHDAGTGAAHDGQSVRPFLDIFYSTFLTLRSVRVGSCGIVDVLMYDTPQDVHILQQEDLTMFGRLVFALCTGNIMASSGGNFQKSLEVMGRLYTPEVKTVALFLVNKGGPHKNIGQLLEIISSRVVAEMGDALSSTDVLENELMGELENARLVRLLCKFGFINERPEFAREPRWSETGDRYIIKLFRDYVFHQIDENGNPVVNLSHVLTCLNKLDAGTDERIMLVARDEQSCLVVSYKDIKACVESAFSELARATTSNNSAATGGYR